MMDRENVNLRLSEQEKRRLSEIANGFSGMRFLSSGLYPNEVSFLLADGGSIEVFACCETVAPGFDVFPLKVRRNYMSLGSDRWVDLAASGQPKGVYLLSKAEWQEAAPLSPRNKGVGQDAAATAQYEGAIADVPNDAREVVHLDAGLLIEMAGGPDLLVATAMFPYSLYVSDCETSEDYDIDIYTRVRLGH